MSSKLILVIGGTGAQGAAVVKALRNTKTPFSVRILTRNPSSEHARAISDDDPGVEFVKGSFMDIESVRQALQGCYGVYVNTDGFTVKAADELWAAIRIWETAKWVPTLRHFVWSSIDYYLKLTDYNPKYGTYHTNAKGRVDEYLRSQDSLTTDNGLAWTILVTGAYDEQLAGGLFTPTIQPDGTRVFALPLAEGHLPFMTLSDLAAFARIIFEDPQTWSGQTLNGLSHWGTGPEIAETVTKVAGVKAVYKPVTIDEWMATIPFASAPYATADPEGPTFEENFRMWWGGMQDSILKVKGTRDLVALKKVHPGLQTLEDWMRETGYDGSPKPFLKGFMDNKVGPGYT